MRPCAPHRHRATRLPWLRTLLCLLVLSAWARAEDLAPDAVGRIGEALAKISRQAIDGELAGLSQRGPLVIQTLFDGTRNTDIVVRRSLIDALMLQDSAQVLAAASAHLTHQQPLVRCSAMAVCVRLRGWSKESLEALFTALKDRNDVVRIAAADRLIDLALLCPNDQDRLGRAFMELAASAASDPHVAVAAGGIRALAMLPSLHAHQAMVNALRGGKAEEIGLLVGQHLQRAHHHGATLSAIVRALTTLIDDNDPAAALPATIALGELQHPEAVAAIRLGCAHRHALVAAACAEALGRRAATAAAEIALDVAAVRPLLTSADLVRRWSAAWTLGRLGSGEAIQDMLNASTLKHGEYIRSIIVSMIETQLPKCPDADDDLSKWAAWWTAKKAAAGAAGIQAQRCGSIDEVSTLSFYSLTDQTRNVSFVIDCSGSMVERGTVAGNNYGGAGTKKPASKLDAARDELWTAVKGLNAGTRFNLICFSTFVTPWRVGPSRAGPRAKAMLREHLDRLTAGGSTNLSDGLAGGLSSYGVETLFALTDGMPTAGVTNMTQLLEFVASSNRKRDPLTRIHTVSFFEPKAEQLLEAIATANGGLFKAVR